MDKISLKQQIDPRRIVRILLVRENGLKIMVDDDVVRELPDGQDMVAEIADMSVKDDTAATGNEEPVNAGVEVQLSLSMN